MGVPKIRNEFHIDRQDLGRADTFRFNVVTYVVEENYDRAIFDLKAFLEKDSAYPLFRGRIERYIAHAIDLVNAIRAKRRFPGASSLTMAKQQELNDRFREHFNELQLVLKRIEKIETDLRIEDMRSTVWVVKALVNSVLVIAVLAFIMDVSHGLFMTTAIVTDDIFLQVTDWIFKKIGM